MTCLDLICHISERCMWFGFDACFYSSLQTAVAGSDASLVVTFLEEKPDA